MFAFSFNHLLAKLIIHKIIPSSEEGVGKKSQESRHAS